MSSIREILDNSRGADGQPPAYAFPGGYPILYDVGDTLLCASCTHDEDPDDIVGFDISYDGENPSCDECGETVGDGWDDPESTKIPPFHSPFQSMGI